MEVRKPSSGPEQGKPIKIQLSSQRLELLAPATAQLVAYLQTQSGVVDIEDSRPLPGIDWKILVDREQASRFGADISSVGNAVQLVTNGIKVGEYRPDDADEELDIRIRFATDYRHIDQLDRLRLQTPQGLVPVNLFAKRVASPSVGNLRRSDEQRVVTVQADVEEGILVNDKIEEIRNQLREFPLDSSIKVTFKGEDEEQHKAQEFLSRAFISGIFMILIILVMQFNSLYQAVLILSAVILSTIGVLLGLLVTQQPFGIVMSGIGVIALAGIVINNNIILIDTYNILRKEGFSPHSAILQTCAQRLRPVLLTAITTVLGLIPMVFKINIDFITREITFGAPSTQWWTQLATAIAGGLTFATLLTLILTPCLLVLFSQRTH
jgi:multidrug efflux pump